MQLTLLIPHLLWPVAAAGAGAPGPRLPALERILARARRQAFPALPLEAWLCRAFEVEQQQDWPVAALTLTLDGGLPGTDYWLRADPVHVRAQRDELRLADAGLLAPTRAEADALIDALNAHFAQDGLELSAPHPNRWYLRLPQPPALATHTLSEAAGADVAGLLPRGEDALHWHRIANEIQMLLHAHPVNAAREERGALPINSLWLWGGGARPAVPGRHFGAVWSSDALSQALATAADLEARPLARGADEWLRDASGTGCETHLVVLDGLDSHARYGDVAAWLEQAAALEQAWFAPLAAGPRAVEHVTIVAPGRASCERFDFAAADRWRFWRRAQPLSAYCPQ